MMDTSFNTSWINETNTKITVQPQDNRQADDGFNSSMLDLKWNLKSFNNDTMYINLTFEDPQSISPSSIYDKLQIDFSGSQNMINCIWNNT